MLPVDIEIVIATAVADHAASIANMFNATGDSPDEDLINATDTLVYLQCWAHVQRAVGLLTC